MKTADIAWLAGLVEGEGCLTPHGASPRIRLVMTDEDVVRRAASLMGTTVRPLTMRQGHHKQQFKTEASGKRAAEWLMTLFPHFGDRRQAKVRDVLRSWRSSPTAGQGTGAKMRLKTHCPQGHPYDEVNTYRHKTGRQCHACRKARSART